MPGQSFLADVWNNTISDANKKTFRFAFHLNDKVSLKGIDKCFNSLTQSQATNLVAIGTHILSMHLLLMLPTIIAPRNSSSSSSSRASASSSSADENAILKYRVPASLAAYIEEEVISIPDEEKEKHDYAISSLFLIFLCFSYFDEPLTVIERLSSSSSSTGGASPSPSRSDDVFRVLQAYVTWHKENFDEEGGSTTTTTNNNNNAHEEPIDDHHSSSAVSTAVANTSSVSSSFVMLSAGAAGGNENSADDRASTSSVTQAPQPSIASTISRHGNSTTNNNDNDDDDDDIRDDRTDDLELGDDDDRESHIGHPVDFAFDTSGRRSATSTTAGSATVEDDRLSNSSQDSNPIRALLRGVTVGNATNTNNHEDNTGSSTTGSREQSQQSQQSQHQQRSTSATNNPNINAFTSLTVQEFNLLRQHHGIVVSSGATVLVVFGTRSGSSVEAFGKFCCGGQRRDPTGFPSLTKAGDVGHFDDCPYFTMINTNINVDLRHNEQRLIGMRCHKGRIETATRTSRSSARKGKHIASWTCCQREAVVADNTCTYKFISERVNGCCVLKEDGRTEEQPTTVYERL